MSISIYNTIAGKKIPLETIKPGVIKMYVCGITAYDYCHIGHARSALVFDMIVRYFKYRGYKVVFVRNFTDIDDKINSAAAQSGVPISTNRRGNSLAVSGFTLAEGSMT